MFGNTRKFYVSIPNVNGQDTGITAYCTVNYKEPSLCIKVKKKEHALLIQDNLEQVLTGNAINNNHDGLKKMFYLDRHPTTTLIRKTTVKSRWFISPFGYESK